MTKLLKAKTKIHCNTCCAPMARVKTIKVQAESMEGAKAEAGEKFKAWRASLVGQNCKICDSIIKAVG